MNLLQGKHLFPITLLHPERPKLCRVLAVLDAIGLRDDPHFEKGGKKEMEELLSLNL